MSDSITALSAFVIGLLGGGHCIGMCGGIVSSLSAAVPDQSSRYRLLSLQLGYNFGRILSYTVIGLLAGYIGHLVDLNMQSAMPLFRLLTGLILIACGLFIAGWWNGISVLEKIGKPIWCQLQPIASRLFPVTTLRSATILGLIWGWLPCGLVYSVLSLSLTSGKWHDGALIMFCFGLGTLPAMLASGFFASILAEQLKKPNVRSVFGGVIILFGLWACYGPLALLLFGSNENLSHHHH